jgi:hypothetical protein
MIEQFLQTQFDSRQAQERLKEVEPILWGLRLHSATFFLILYLVVPALVVLYGLPAVIIPAAVIMFIFAITISVLYFVAHKQLFPALTAERFNNTAKMILCPPAAIRVGDLISLEAVSQYHPIVVATLLLKSDGENVTRRLICDLKHPTQHPSCDSRDIEIASWFNSMELKASITYLSDNGCDIEKLLQSPIKDDECNVYCPRCDAQFSSAGGLCPDCPGVGLQEFNASVAKEARCG